ncbi:T5orf172 domain-containing protein [Succinivibrio dextrinosolvens DSM 3072]|uniref:T5orf172 domain-containing protein n=1 Tax=Succinivibrio dextrinosolvens DSM 3072 TaxID=1123324 RepID=A0A1T4V1G3_9GAMM|nr:GIY-YIG nuclease family protein [Succinivibrio dextrinosolvens]SKA58718.1 T5orf172 domain-containing protein [Succinivibrio dextrinosolvens DSM 3072]
MKLTSKKEFKKPESFDELLLDDPFGLLANVGEKRLSMSVSDKIKAAFEEIADFVKSNNRLPSVDSDDFDEELLAEKFNALIKDAPEGKTYCESFLEENKDKNLLEGMHIFSKEKALDAHIEKMETTEYNSVDDIFNDDPLGLLSDVGDKAVEEESWHKDREESSSTVDGKVAKQKVCKDFFKYQRYFDEINRLLSEGHLISVPIHGDNASIQLADIFVVNGVMSIIADVDDDSTYKIKSSRKLTYRVKQIFINGTESTPLSTSIKTTFYAKSDIPGRRIIHADPIGLNFIEDMRNELMKTSEGSANAIMTGYIYILSSRSKHPVIKKFTEQSSLVKIGYCTTDVATRIANAEKDPTYLCAPVNVLKTFQCYNFDPRNLEDVLHTILASHKLHVELKDINGNTFRPREWFTVSVETASDIIDHLFAGDIADYYIDKIQGKLKRK